MQGIRAPVGVLYPPAILSAEICIRNPSGSHGPSSKMQVAGFTELPAGERSLWIICWHVALVTQNDQKPRPYALMMHQRGSCTRIKPRLRTSRGWRGSHTKVWHATYHRLRENDSSLKSGPRDGSVFRRKLRRLSGRCENGERCKQVDPRDQKTGRSRRSRFRSMKPLPAPNYHLTMLRCPRFKVS